MNTQPFASHTEAEALRQRGEALLRGDGAALREPRAPATAAAAEIQSALEEMQRAEAELRRQNEAMAGSRLAAEGEQRHLAFLAEASLLLATSLDYETTLTHVARLAVPHVADGCTVEMVEPDGSLRRRAATHSDPAKGELARVLRRRYPDAPDAGHGVPHVLRTGQADFMFEIPDAVLVAGARDPAHLQMLRELGLNSFMGVPLVARGRTLGVLSFVATEAGRRFGPADLRLAEDLAGRAALAIDNARLYHEAQTARLEAEAARAALAAADRLKDEFLAKLAHELRNPLAPILTAVQLLEATEASDPRLRRARAVIERQVRHQTRLIEDLLDVSRITHGKMGLRREGFPLQAAAGFAIDVCLPAIRARGQELVVELPNEPLRVNADPVRLEQVITNLLTNAHKYTDPGGCLGLTVCREGEAGVVRVRDSGIGISPAMLPRVFDLFVQADPSPGLPRGGLGIGLTLVKALVELHGGVIEAHSAGLGQGSEFVVRLPLGPD